MFASTPLEVKPARYTLRDAMRDAGGDLGNVSKMPASCRSYGYSVKVCRNGGVLRKVKGSVCFKCYADGDARGGNYAYPSVRKAHDNRLAAWYRDPDAWVRGMTRLIDARTPYDAPIAELAGTQGVPHGVERVFRWHDSGDVLSLEHLHALCEIALALPDVMFWLPTKEYADVARYALIFGAFPANLCCRQSVARTDRERGNLRGPVSLAFDASSGRPNCPAYADPDPASKLNCDNGPDGPCRKCWTPDETPCYPVH